jgi:hypothetical protein
MSTVSNPGAAERRNRPWLALVSLTLAGLGFFLVGGLSGVVAAVALGVAWYVFPAPYAVAGGHLLFVALLPADPGLLLIAPAELGLLGILAAAAPDEAPERFVAVLAGATLLLSGVAGFSFRFGGLTTAAVSVAVVALLLGYGLHRYERLRLGLLDTPGSDSDSGADTNSDRGSGADTGATIDT